MRASMRIGPYAPVCACAHALACKIAGAHACICLSRIEYHNLATVRTQPSTPPEHARTGTHSRGCTPEADSAGGDAITLALPDPDRLAMHVDLGIDTDFMDIDSGAVSPHPYPEHFRVHNCTERAPRTFSSRWLPCRVSCRGVAGA